MQTQALGTGNAPQRMTKRPKLANGLSAAADRPAAPAGPGDDGCALQLSHLPTFTPILAGCWRAANLHACAALLP